VFDIGLYLKESDWSRYITRRGILLRHILVFNTRVNVIGSHNL